MPDRPGPPEDPAVLPTAIAAISRVARGMVTPPETEDGRLRVQAESRRRQLDALAELIARRATRAAEAGRPPGPTDPTPEPRPAPPSEPPTPGAGLTDGQARWLGTLGPEARAEFDGLSPAMRSRLLAPHRDGLNVDPILEREAARVLAPRPPAAPPPPMPGTTAGLLENLPGAPPHWAQAAAEALARDFGGPKDRKLWPALLRVTLAVWQGQFPADAVLDAYRQGMGPKSKNRGAVFNTALRANGWVWEPGA